MIITEQNKLDITKKPVADLSKEEFLPRVVSLLRQVVLDDGNLDELHPGTARSRAIDDIVFLKAIYQERYGQSLLNPFFNKLEGNLKRRAKRK